MLSVRFGAMSTNHRLPVRLENPAQSLALIAVSVLLGFLLTAQLQTVRSRPIGGPEYGRSLSIATIQRLEDEQRSLKEAIASLRGQLVALQGQAIQGAGDLATINQELERQRLVAGLLPLRGPGVQVTLDDSARPIPAGEDPANYLIHDYELRDIVNLLWLAGAEAIAINEERVVANTSIYCVGSTIIVNSTRLSPPYEIRAIGDASFLEEVLRDPSTLKKVKSKAQLYGVQFRWAQVRDLTLPAYTGSVAIKYAVPPKK